MMKSSYLKEDVIILLKDLSGLIEPLGTKEREKKIQSGSHYSEMLPKEYKPSKEYMETYEEALSLHSKDVADSVARLSERIIYKKGYDVVLISLARAGTSIGILVKRYLKYKCNIDVFHYTISIIRGKGIDHNAMNYILERHSEESLQFIDGWTGKGAINKELQKELELYPKVTTDLGVVADPAYITELCGTHEDFLIPSSCLNSTVSGLLSRTFHSDSIILKGDFHGAVYYEDLIHEDLTYDFINKVEGFMRDDIKYSQDNIDEKYGLGIKEVEKIKEEFMIKDINFIKPGIGETTRVLLRRVPWKILVNSLDDDENLGHIYRLSKEKNIEIIEYPLISYRACGIIKDISADV